MRMRGWLLIFIPAMSLCAACRSGDAQPTDFTLPEGFEIEVLVNDIPNAREMAMGSQGTLFVSTRSEGKVYAVTGIDSGTPRVTVIARDLNMPNGVAFRDGDLYVAEISRILKYPGIESRVSNPPQAVVVADDFPSDRHHGWKFIDFGPDGKLYVPIGAPCNICDEPGYAVITRMNPDGTEREVYARGVRNTVGFTWHPETAEMWFTDNGRDWMGDDQPPCELNHAPSAGMHFGYPYCHGIDIADPEFGEGVDCSKYTPPAQPLGAHVAPLGIEFYSGKMFPAEYRMQAFIAEHGSWNRSDKVGYRISLVRMRDGVPVSYEAFAEGWLKDGNVSGRPVDLLTLADGSMLVSDDHGGRIFRISYRGL